MMHGLTLIVVFGEREIARVETTTAPLVGETIQTGLSALVVERREWVVLGGRLYCQIHVREQGCPT